MPPYQWVSWRYIIRPRPGDSKSDRTVEPLAEKPDADSNTLLTICSTNPTPGAAKVPASTKGRAPATVVRIHVQETAAKT